VEKATPKNAKGEAKGEEIKRGAERGTIGKMIIKITTREMRLIIRTK